MSVYTVDTRDNTKINFAPATLQEEVAQNIRTILSTPVGSAPFARSIGVNYEFLDEPQAIIQARIQSEAMTAIMEQEPRAMITEIEVIEIDHESGRIYPIVRFTLNEEVNGGGR